MTENQRNKFNEDEYLLKLGQRITDLREASGLSRDLLAFKVGTTRMQIYRIENGIKKHSPTISMLMRLAMVFNTSIDKLVKID